MSPINLYSPKGGSGVTVTAAMLAIALAETEPTVLVADSADEAGDLCAAIGLPATTSGVAVNDNLTLVVGPYRGDATVVMSSHTDVPGARNLLVTRLDYLALRRAVNLPQAPDGIIVVEEPGRALHVVDAERAIGAPVIAVVAWDPAIARAVDAGLLGTRHPALGRLLAHDVAEAVGTA